MTQISITVISNKYDPISVLAIRKLGNLNLFGPDFTELRFEYWNLAYAMMMKQSKQSFESILLE
jgi:hypothetical protein